MGRIAGESYNRDGARRTSDAWERAANVKHKETPVCCPWSNCASERRRGPWKRFDHGAILASSKSKRNTCRCYCYNTSSYRGDGCGNKQRNNLFCSGQKISTKISAEQSLSAAATKKIFYKFLRGARFSTQNILGTFPAKAQGRGSRRTSAQKQGLLRRCGSNNSNKNNPEAGRRCCLWFQCNTQTCNARGHARLQWKLNSALETTCVSSWPNLTNALCITPPPFTILGFCTCKPHIHAGRLLLEHSSEPLQTIAAVCGHCKNLLQFNPYLTGRCWTLIEWEAPPTWCPRLFVMTHGAESMRSNGTCDVTVAWINIIARKTVELIRKTHDLAVRYFKLLFTILP